MAIYLNMQGELMKAWIICNENDILVIEIYFLKYQYKNLSQGVDIIATFFS